MTAPVSESVFSDLVACLASRPGDRVVLLKSYFDESYETYGRGWLCVGGYTFSGSGARALDRGWAQMLRRYNLPYFRMSACNSRQPPFDRLSEVQCIAVATEAISLIKKHMAFGVCTAVNQESFAKIVMPGSFVRTPYELCAWFCLIESRMLSQEHLPRGKASFFFEAGFRDKGAANAMMNRIFSDPNLKELYGYKSHAFVDKEECLPSQAADLFAWQVFKQSTRRAKRISRPRGDLAALLDGTLHRFLVLEEPLLQRMVDHVNAYAASQHVPKLPA